jgi:RHS repeat-associated protein
MIQCITDSVDSGRKETYAYDALARLTAAATAGSAGYPQWGLSWTYDRYGNRTAQIVTSGSAPSNSVAVSPTTNQITTSGYGYDLNGNMTNDGQNSLIYNAENRITSSSGSPGSGTYAYDGGGLRVTKVSGSTTMVYAFSGSKVIAEYVNGAAPTSPAREYIYSGSSLLAKIESGATQYYQQDILSVRVMTDSSGNKIGEQGNFPFGESWYQTNTTTKWQFTSYERDAESGSDYAVARFDVNRLGRFSAPDPIAGSQNDPQSLNRYPYVLNDPANLVDPAGLDACPPGVGCPNNPPIVVITRVRAPKDPPPDWLWGLWLDYFLDGMEQFADSLWQSEIDWSNTGLCDSLRFNCIPHIPPPGLAEALNRLENADCQKLFSNNKQGLNPVDVLGGTTYRILPFPPGSTAGAQTNSVNDVSVNANGPYANESPTVYIPSDSPNISSFREVTFGTADQKRAFIFLHELGHQVGVFGPDVFKFINGSHSLQVLQDCFKDAHVE